MAEEESIDLKGAWNFVVKHRVILLLLIPIILSVYIRVQPLYLPITDDWAEAIVYNGVRNHVNSEVERVYPNLPIRDKEEMISSEVQKVYEQRKGEVDNQIRLTSNLYKEILRDENGNPYLLAIDPWLWMMYSRNILENGHPGDRIVNGLPYDSFMYAPIGRFVPRDMFHAYATVYLYKAVKTFKPSFELIQAAFFMPIIIITLSLIPAFFIVRKVAGDVGGLFASVMIAAHPSMLVRTMGGFSDTDAYTVFFPLLITWVFVEAYEAKTTIKRTALSALSGFLIGVFAFTWTGWWYIFDFILGLTTALLVYQVIIRREEVRLGWKKFLLQEKMKNVITTLSAFFFSSMIFVTIFSSFIEFSRFMIGPSLFIKLKQVAVTTIWPNVFTTIEEHNPATLLQIINAMGGKFLLFLAMTGILLSLINLKKPEKEDLAFIFLSAAWYVVMLVSVSSPIYFAALSLIPLIIKLLFLALKKRFETDAKYAVLISVWFFATLYASTKGTRFMLLLVPAFSLGFGMFAGKIYDSATSKFPAEFKTRKTATQIITFLILALVLITPIQASQKIMKSEVPSFNDAWQEVLSKIDKEAEQDAIITSWWDYGHWFKAVGKRAVTFDGASQNTPQAYWVGRSLLTSDERVSVGILRMLCCGANAAFEKLDKVNGDTLATINLLNEIVTLNREGARKKLEEHVSSSEAEEVLELTHCEPLEDYYITSQDMVKTSGVWAHIGGWNFTRASMYGKVRSSLTEEEALNTLMDEFGAKDAKEAYGLYYEIKTQKPDLWISAWPSYHANTVSGCEEKEGLLYCDNGIRMNVTESGNIINAEFMTEQGARHPESTCFVNETGFFVKEFKEDFINLSAALIPTEGGYMSVLMKPELAGSIFTQLFFFDGHGSRHFKPFNSTESVTLGKINIFKVDWEGKEIHLKENLTMKKLII